MRRNRIAQTCIGLLTALLLAAAAPGTAAAEKTDILLLVDTTGSMETALQPAVEDIQEITDRVRGELGDVNFGVAQVRDYPIAILEGSASDRPYEVVQPVTGDSVAVATALDSLVAFGGGDGPEAYGRALRDADVGNGLGWRSGARRLVVMVADNVPHDDDLNWGIPSAAQTRSTPFDTIRDPGDDAIVGNGDDIDWQGLMTQLGEHGLPLMFVLFEGEEDLLPYWQTWAGWTGGTAASGDVLNLSNLVVDLARRGATAKLPECPTGQTRDEARRCRPYTDWLGYSFQNGDLPEWAGRLRLGRDDVLTKELVSRTFRDAELRDWWWAFWQSDPRGGWWDSMSGGVCYGMALSGGRFSTALQPFQSAPDGRGAATWAVSQTPQLPAPLSGADGTYTRELVQTIGTDFVSQFSTEAQAAIHDQLSYFGSRAGSGQAAAAMRSQLETTMSSGRGNVGRTPLGSERGAGLAMVVFYDDGGGHAVVAYRVRDSGGGSFQIDVWDNNRFGKIDSIAVHSDGSWDYVGGLDWHGDPGQNIAFLPEYPARGLHLSNGGTSSSGREVTVADIPAGASDVRVKAETEKGAPAEAYVLPIPTGSPGDGSTAVADGSRLQVSLSDKQAGAVARGHGTILSAQGLTGGGGSADIAFDVEQGSVAASSPLAGTLAVTRSTLHASSDGASGLALADSGAVTLRAKRGGTVSLSLAAASGERISSTTLTVRMPRRGVATIGAAEAKRAIRRGGRVRVRIGRGKGAETVVATTQSIAASYGLRAHVRVKGKRAKLTLTADRRIPGDAEGEVVWRAKRGKRVVGRRGVELDRVRTERRLASFAIPAGLRRGEIEAVVRVVVRRPGPARLVARDSVELRPKGKARDEKKQGKRSPGKGKGR